jgi:hypothetical protein
MPDPNAMAAIHLILSGYRAGFGGFLPLAGGSDSMMVYVHSWRILDAARLLFTAGGWDSITLYSNATCGLDAEMWVWNRKP